MVGQRLQKAVRRLIIARTPPESATGTHKSPGSVEARVKLW